MLIINNPENPVSLEWYADSEWYKDQLKFLESLSKDKIHFFDMRSNLSMQDFSDYHHVTYSGMKALNLNFYTYLIGILYFAPIQVRHEK